MTFCNAKCDLCGQYHDKPDNLVAFTVRHHALEQIDLRGEQPWSGVRVVCRRCIRFFREATDAASQGEHYRKAANALELVTLTLMRRFPREDPLRLKAAKVVAEWGEPLGMLRSGDD